MKVNATIELKPNGDIYITPDYSTTEEYIKLCDVFDEFGKHVYVLPF